MNQDLRSRIPVAIIYVLVIVVMTFAGKTTSAILCGLFAILTLYEFISITNKNQKQNSIIIYSVSILILLSGFFGDFTLKAIQLLTLFSCIFFLINIFHLVLKHKSLTNITSIYLSTLIYIVIPFLIAIACTRKIESFPMLLLGTFIILWLNDAGAYFVGKAMGKHKLFEAISPKKTWEGSIGGGAIGILVSVLIPFFLNIYDIQTWLILSVIIWISGTYGDLVESHWKRFHQIKDSGTNMKGHGGFLDRLDSFIYAVPFVVFYILFITPNYPG